MGKKNKLFDSLKPKKSKVTEERLKRLIESLKQAKKQREDLDKVMEVKCTCCPVHTPFMGHY